MTDYNGMSVDELLFEFAELERNHVGTHWEIHDGQGVVVEDPNPLNAIARKAAIVSAIRKAVIREASVGVVKLSHNGVASDYDIIPHKETP